MFASACQVGHTIRPTGIIYCAIALGIKMASIRDFSKKLFFLQIPVQGGQGGWKLSSAGHGYRLSFASEDPVSAPYHRLAGTGELLSSTLASQDYLCVWLGVFSLLAGCPAPSVFI